MEWEEVSGVQLATGTSVAVGVVPSLCWPYPRRRGFLKMRIISLKLGKRTTINNCQTANTSLRVVFGKLYVR